MRPIRTFVALSSLASLTFACAERGPRTPSVDAGPPSSDGAVVTAGPGEACESTSSCAEGLTCVEHEGAVPSPVCMVECDPGTTRLCDGGAVCLSLAVGGACYLGGSVAVGEACGSALECVRGSICVLADEAQVCHRACSTRDGSGCVAGERCAALVGGEGYCEASAP